MAKLNEEHQQYLTDEMYLPISYRFELAKKPVYKGRGNHSISELEKMCEQYKEYCHQQQIIKQNAMRHLVETKFDIKID